MTKRIIIGILCAIALLTVGCAQKNQARKIDITSMKAGEKFQWEGFSFVVPEDVQITDESKDVEGVIFNISEADQTVIAVSWPGSLGKVDNISEYGAKYLSSDKNPMVGDYEEADVINYKDRYAIHTVLREYNGISVYIETYIISINKDLCQIVFTTYDEEKYISVFDEFLNSIQFDA